MQSFKHIGIQPAGKNKFYSCMNIRRYGEKLFHKQRQRWGMNGDNGDSECMRVELYPQVG